ncbi:MAG: DUF1569 domain-containing protein [Chitinophagaceae bacterium]
MNFLEIPLSGELHPFLGNLTKEEWRRGKRKHLDHHLQQLAFKFI